MIELQTPVIRLAAEVDVDKEESVVAQWLAHLPLVLHVEVPACVEENFGVRTRFP